MKAVPFLKEIMAIKKVDYFLDTIVILWLYCNYNRNLARLDSNPKEPSMIIDCSSKKPSALGKGVFHLSIWKVLLIYSFIPF